MKDKGLFILTTTIPPNGSEKIGQTGVTEADVVLPATGGPTFHPVEESLILSYVGMMETILENFFCQLGVGFQDREDGGRKSELFHTDPIDAGEETVHVVMPRTLHQPRPIHLSAMFLHEKCPIQDLTQGHTYR